MPYAKHLSALEVLGIAIMSEIEAASYYKKIKNAIKNPALKEKLSFLVGEEQKHRRILADIYHKKANGVRLSKPPDSLVPRPITQKGKTTVSVLLKSAMKAELDAENFYTMLIGKMKDPQASIILRYIAKMENSHYHILENEVEIISRARDLKEMMHLTDEAVHLGP
ncbi:MAG: ferritin family protein [Planctomycetes bacterium]|nr:ferritin family protein [Planctomycetota bacterium]